MASLSQHKRGVGATTPLQRALVRVLVGPAGAGKTRWLLGRYRSTLAEGPVGCGLWLAPNGQTAATVRERLLDDALPGCLQPNVVTFAGLADAVLRHASAERYYGRAPADAGPPVVLRSIADLAKRSMLRRVVEQRRGELAHFAPIAHTQGFLDALADVISELKRAEIWPEELRAAAQQRGLTSRDGELVGLYGGYQDLLSTFNLYDREGRMWLARDQLARGFREPFAAVRVVVADGFTDFTRTQYDMLESLAATAGEVLVSLPYEADAEREEVFATTSETLAQLRRRFDVEAVNLAGRRRRGAAAGAGLAALEWGLFRHPRRRTAATNGEGIEILEAPGREGEVRVVAQRIKRLLVDDVPPDDVVIVVRRADDYAPLVCEVFREQGIPVSVEVRAPLTRCPVVKALLAVLALPERNWRFPRLAAVLKSNFLAPRWPEWSGPNAGLEALAAIRRLRIPFGRDAYLRALERTADRARGDEQVREPARRAAALLGWLAECLDRFAKQATPAGWIAALGALVEDLGVGAGGRGRDGQYGEDAAELERLFDGLEQWAWAEQLHGAGKLNRAEFLEALGQVLRWQTVAAAPAREGTVRFLAASEVRNLRVPYLFVAGLAEGEFPQGRGEDPFYGEAERESLSRQGLALGHRTARLHEEMLLFYSVVTRAEKRLVLSYPAVDAQGAPLLASPFLEDVRRTFRAGALATDRRELLAAVPERDDVSGPADLRVRAVADAAEGRTQLLASLAASAEHGAVAENILAGLGVTHDRFQVRRFGVYDGIVCGANAVETLADRFGPEYRFSPSQLGTYQTCPFRFYLSSVVGLAAQEEPDWRSSPAVRGQIVHFVLAELHRWLRQRADGLASPAAVPREELLAEYAALLQRAMHVFVPAADRSMPLWDLERRLLLEWGSAYPEQHAGYEQACANKGVVLEPAYFELSFGMTREAAPELKADSLSVADPLILGEGPGEVRVCGRIDRVDVGRCGGRVVFNVVDYKTGAYVPSKKVVQSGADLQLPLYALAVERLFAPLFVASGAQSGDAGAVGLSAGYWKIQDTGFQESLPLGEAAADAVGDHPQWSAMRGSLEARVVELAGAIRRAEFPVASTDDHCTRYCPYATVCRINQVRSVEKPWPV